MLSNNYFIYGKTLVEKNIKLIQIIKEYVTILSKKDLKQSELYDLQFFALEFMRNSKTIRDPESCETKLDPDPSDPALVRHYCDQLLILLDCRNDLPNLNYPCSTCQESISEFLANIILQYEDRMTYRN